MPKQVTAWQTIDGELHSTEKDALEYELTTDSLGYRVKESRLFLHPTEGLTEMGWDAYQDLKQLGWKMPPYQSLIIAWRDCKYSDEGQRLWTEHYLKNNTFEQIHQDES